VNRKEGKKHLPESDIIERDTLDFYAKEGLHYSMFTVAMVCTTGGENREFIDSILSVLDVKYAYGINGHSGSFDQAWSQSRLYSFDLTLPMFKEIIDSRTGHDLVFVTCYRHSDNTGQWNAPDPFFFEAVMKNWDAMTTHDRIEKHKVMSGITNMIRLPTELNPVITRYGITHLI